MHSLVGSRDMQGLAIGIRIDGHRRDPEPTRRPDDAAGDLAAIGNQDLFQHRRIHRPHGNAALRALSRPACVGCFSGAFKSEGACITCPVQRFISC